MKREWYKHLASQGFEDIEKGLRLVDHKNTEDLAYIKDFQTTDQFIIKQNYFIWAEQMAHHGSFRSVRDQMIWEYHAENIPRDRIAMLVGIGDRWCSRKILQIRDYLMNAISSQSAVYG